MYLFEHRQMTERYFWFIIMKQAESFLQCLGSGHIGNHVSFEQKAIMAMTWANDGLAAE